MPTEIYIEALLVDAGHTGFVLQEVRFAIVDVTDGREFVHRLRDYNNLPETKFENVKEVLEFKREGENELAPSDRFE